MTVWKHNTGNIGYKYLMLALDGPSDIIVLQHFFLHPHELTLQYHRLCVIMRIFLMIYGSSRTIHLKVTSSVLDVISRCSLTFRQVNEIQISEVAFDTVAAL